MPRPEEAPIDGHPHAGLPREVVALHVAAEDAVLGHYRGDSPEQLAEAVDALKRAFWAVSDRPLTLREWLISTWWDIRARWALRPPR